MHPEKPHDKFFKEAFSRLDITSDFLQAYLPHSLLENLDFASLRQETDSYTDEQLSEHFADLVFSAQFGDQPIRITLLLEHKSYTEPYPHFQLNRYLLAIWERQIRQRTALTPVLPVVLYHGRGRWQKRPADQYFGKLAPELMPFIPAFDYVLIDLTDINRKLPALTSDYARLTGLLLQYSRRKRDLMRILDEHAQIIRTLALSAPGRTFVSTTLVYLNWASGLTPVEIITIFERISTQAGELAMSAAQTWINQGLSQGLEQGLTQGIEQGLTQGLERGIRGMVKLGMDAKTIAAALDMSQTDVDTIIARINAESR